MRAGETLTDLSPSQARALNGAIRLAEDVSALTFSVYLGLAGADSRATPSGCTPD